MDNKKENNIFKKPWFWLVIAMMVLIIFLPVLSDMYAGLVPYKVNPKMINLNRLELLKIFLSLIGPYLTYLVFNNTVSIQEQAKNDRKNDKKEDEKRRKLDDANREFYSLLDLFKKEQEKSETKDSIERIFETVKDKNSEELHDINAIINRYTENYKVTSSYFKIVHRILKNLNKRLDEKQIGKGEYRNYIGILRAQLSSVELVVILVNSLFIKRGLGLGIELIGTNLFGDERDFKVNQHFDIPKGLVTLEFLLIFVNDKEGNNIMRRIQYEEKLEKIDDIEKYESIKDFQSFIK
ncbi:putative phage abortive infection protein [Lactococcus lactis]|uniref:putative phage abortive infection protein n=1 Tax=Lactococcus lactis TaxID=1358 RepID=UPI0003486500|nr:putative phage abortive infection protein [Lactococcus lactis]ATY88398.1 hypothetical protein CV702_09645 [Lactococcus lactis subsp. lactis]ATZ01974.1 hypothetical protein CV098_09370 [Lactococcus lactis subsp. lactis]KST95832.1 hypothetical protein KF146_1864 [Lactococcus lactis subsp. lactis]MDU0396843.1 hypothetical protein [Lactococcus lactis]QOK49805.1 hypothetical protein HZ322_09325 [Lactococcus lactis]